MGQRYDLPRHRPANLHYTNNPTSLQQQTPQHASNIRFSIITESLKLRPSCLKSRNSNEKQNWHHWLSWHSVNTISYLISFPTSLINYWHTFPEQVKTPSSLSNTHIISYLKLVISHDPTTNHRHTLCIKYQPP